VKIKIIEKNTVLDIEKPTGRVWDIEISGEEVRYALTEFTNEIRWLIEYAKNSLR
jgi:hypothetical protein